MKYLLIFLLSIIIFSCNTKESNNNNTDKAAINLDDSTDNNINKTEQSIQTIKIINQIIHQ